MGANTGDYAAGVTEADVGVTDTGVTTACVGGCFDYEVTGLADGASINVVLPLATAIPADTVVRKFANGEWRDYSLLGGDAVASAPGGPGTCPAPGDAAYTSGLNEGDYCVQLTITDGGRNDADGTANGTIIDPVGLGAADVIDDEVVSNIGDPDTGGGGAMGWISLAGLLAWMGFSRRKLNR